MDLHFDLSSLNNLVMTHFYPLLIDKHRFLVLRGGAGSGKSVFCVIKIIVRILFGYKSKTIHNILVIMKTQSSMGNTVIAEFRKWLIKFNILNTICEEKKSPPEFNFSNGSRIFFLGCDDPDKLLSLSGVTSIWLEEASRETLNDFEIINTRLRGIKHTYQQIMLSFNPISKLNWIYKHFYSNSVENTTLHLSLLKDNYLLDDQEYKKQIEDFKYTNINKYNVYWLGQWGSLEGGIYDNFDVVDTMPENPHEVIYGLDFGTTAKTALVRIVEYDDEFWLQEKIYKTGMITADIVRELEHIMPENEKSSTIYCDSAEADRIEEIYRAGYYAEKSKKDVIAGIDFCKSKKIHIHKDSYNLIKEMEGYSWEIDKEGVSREKPCKIDDHACDAFRYALYTHFSDKRDYNLIIP
jgi:phage terminase large subunit